jgi:hypothetical protein
MNPSDDLTPLYWIERAVLNAAAAEHRTRLNLAAVLFERRDARENRLARQEHELADRALGDASAAYVAYIDANKWPKPVATSTAVRYPIDDFDERVDRNIPDWTDRS